jgi:hypothetical protein
LPGFSARPGNISLSHATFTCCKKVGGFIQEPWKIMNVSWCTPLIMCSPMVNLKNPRKWVVLLLCGKVNVLFWSYFCSAVVVRRSPHTILDRSGQTPRCFVLNLYDIIRRWQTLWYESCTHVSLFDVKLTLLFLGA